MRVGQWIVVSEISGCRKWCRGASKCECGSFKSGY